MQTFIKVFDDIGKKDTAIAGGKGASLGEMTQAGIPVPPGFVIASDAFDKFIQDRKLNVKIDAILDKLNHEDPREIEKASGKIRGLIINEKISDDIAHEIEKAFANLKQLEEISPNPSLIKRGIQYIPPFQKGDEGGFFVAVRSSATAEDSAGASWAGQLESYLNTTEENLLENVKKCWASLFTPRAIYYRLETHLRPDFAKATSGKQGFGGQGTLNKQKISVAVIVQKMIQSEVSGIAFSVHPVTEDFNQLIIEASYGLGEAIVSGQVTPDSYVVEKKEKKIVEKMVQDKNRGIFLNSSGKNEWQDIPVSNISKQALTDMQILELSDLIIKIEKHYGFPVDIEWAMEKGKFYIVQSRPITTLSK